MDKNKLDYFVARYGELDEDALAELQIRIDTLAEEAAAALDIVLAKRGIDRTLLVQLAKESEVPLRSEPKRNAKLMAAQLAAVSVVVVLSKALAEILPRWVGLIVLLGGIGLLGSWIFRWFGKK
jgi:hypothetical protein